MTLRWGIVSTGNICSDFTAALKQLTNSSVEGVASRTHASASAFASKHAIPKVYSEEEMFKSSDIDAVYIGSVSSSHYSSSLKALSHKKHVLCEKPISVNSDQFKHLMSVAKENNVFLMEAHWSRCFPVWRKVRSLIDEGSIGEVRQVHADFGFKASATRGGARLWDPALAGGSLLDIGVYPISLATMCFGKGPEQVKALADLTDRGVDEGVAMSLSYGPGAKASLSCTLASHTGCDAKIVGTHGRIRVEYPFWCPTKFTLTTYDKPDPSDADPLGVDQTFEFSLPEYDGQLNFPNSEGLLYEAQEAEKCILEGKLESDAVPWSQSLAIAETVEAVKREIGLTFPPEVEAVRGGA